MAKKNKNGIIDEYAYIEINKRKRLVATLSFLGITAGIMLILVEQKQLELNWVASVPGVTLIGLCSLLVPLSEKWVYKPWQKSPQKYEATKISKVYKY